MFFARRQRCVAPLPAARFGAIFSPLSPHEVCERFVVFAVAIVEVALSMARSTHDRNPRPARTINDKQFDNRRRKSLSEPATRALPSTENEFLTRGGVRNFGLPRRGCPSGGTRSSGVQAEFQYDLTSKSCRLNLRYPDLPVFYPAFAAV